MNKGIELDISDKSTKPVEFKHILKTGLASSGRDEVETAMISLMNTKTTVLSGMLTLNPNEKELFNLITIGVWSVLKCMLLLSMAFPGFLNQLLKL